MKTYDNKLEKVVRYCAKKINRFTEEQIVQVIKKFENQSPKVAMKVLTRAGLDFYKDSNKAEFQAMLKEIFKLNDGSYSRAQDIVNEIKADKEKELKEQEEKKKENHKIVNESIQEICNKFNELGIDYYIVGALPVYLASGKMIRIHEDIDFMVAEKDLSKVAEALQGTVYNFKDKRLNSPRVLDENGNLTCGDHEVVAERKDGNDFHLGFFMFKREKDGSVTQREYHARIDENGKKIPVLQQRKFSKELFEYNYGDEPVKYLDTEFKSSTPESVYDIKSYMLGVEPRNKDKIDVDYWKTAKKSNGEELISEERLKQMGKISEKYKTILQSSDVSQELIEQILMQQDEIKNIQQGAEQALQIKI